MKNKIKKQKANDWMRGVLFVFSLLLIGLGACSYDIKEFKPVETPDTVSFNNDVLPFMETSCSISGCHSSGGIPPDLSAANAYVSLTVFGYVDTANAELSPIYVKITTGSMAKYSNDQDRAILLKWIEQGAKNN